MLLSTHAFPCALKRHSVCTQSATCAHRTALQLPIPNAACCILWPLFLLCVCSASPSIFVALSHSCAHKAEVLPAGFVSCSICRHVDCQCSSTERDLSIRPEGAEQRGARSHESVHLGCLARRWCCTGQWHSIQCSLPARRAYCRS